MDTVAVIGGGPAGMMAAGRLGERGKNVVLIEKNPMLGKKLRITGKGRCNITNACDTEEMLNNVVVNRSFLYSAFYTFTNDDVIALLNNNGLETKVERGGRVFPASDSARDVAETLKKYCCKKNVRVIKNKAEDIIIENGAVCGVKLSGGEVIKCSRVIVATGGRSYPLTGSTGDGYRFAQKAGHTVTEIKPSLVPMETEEKWTREAMGLSLKNVKVKFTDGNGKRIYEDFGEMLFTHFGVSGPVILSASAHLRDFKHNSYTLAVDLKPALDSERLNARIIRDFASSPTRHLVNALSDLLPHKLIGIIIKNAGLEEHIPVNQINKQMRGALADSIKNLTLHIRRLRPIDEAIVTSGGVCVKEINPSTMESKLVSGLYFAGEVIDADAYTGGFNLQIAFSTGYLAGDNA